MRWAFMVFSLRFCPSRSLPAPGGRNRAALPGIGGSCIMSPKVKMLYPPKICFVPSIRVLKAESMAASSKCEAKAPNNSSGICHASSIKIQRSAWFRVNKTSMSPWLNFLSCVIPPTAMSPAECTVAPPMAYATRFWKATHRNSTPCCQPIASLNIRMIHLITRLLPAPGKPCTTPRMASALGSFFLTLRLRNRARGSSLSNATSTSKRARTFLKTPHCSVFGCSSSVRMLVNQSSRASP